MSRLVCVLLVLPLASLAQQKITWEKDGREMVLIPVGSFEMEDHFNEGSDSERPVHTVELDEFYMDVNGKMTVGQFREFVNQSGYKYGVNWNDATAYAKWVSKRLPTEAEWEYAARGGRVGKRYPWGDDKNVAGDHANHEGIGEEGTAPVGSFEANGYGLHDMAGNAWEWCQDYYEWDYYSKSPVNNPRGPAKGRDHVLRGGCWFSPTKELSVALRSYFDPRHSPQDYGFRCVSNRMVHQN